MYWHHYSAKIQYACAISHLLIIDIWVKFKDTLNYSRKIFSVQGQKILFKDISRTCGTPGIRYRNRKWARAPVLSSTVAHGHSKNETRLEGKWRIRRTNMARNKVSSDLPTPKTGWWITGIPLFTYVLSVRGTLRNTVIISCGNRKESFNRGLTRARFVVTSVHPRVRANLLINVKAVGTAMSKLSTFRMRCSIRRMWATLYVLSVMYANWPTSGG